MKAKFYPLRTLFFTFLLSFGFSETINAQTLELDVRDATTGGDGTRTSFGNDLSYTFWINGDATMTDIMISCPIPNGTTYVPGSTTMEGIPVADVNGAMPWVNPTLIPAPTTGLIRIRFYVHVTATAGVIRATATMQRGTNSPILDQTETIVLQDNSCSNKFYSLTTLYPLAYFPVIPNKYWPYQFIRTLDVTTGTNTLLYDGRTGACKDAATQVDLPAGSILTDATATAFQTSSNRLYFVNQPVNNVPADLCYFTEGNSVAYKITGQPLTQNATSFITRMAMDAAGNGYAITDNGMEFIHFIPGASSVVVNNHGPLINDPNNLPNNDVLNETGGDIICNGTDYLILITFSGKVYSINTSTRVTTFKGSINGLPAAGCNAVTIDRDGSIYIGGRYPTLYKLEYATLTLTSVSNYSYASMDFAGCAVPVFPPRIAVTEKEIRNEVIAVSAKVQPNPFLKELNLQVQLTTAEAVKVRLIDFYGRTVYTTTKQLGAGSNSLRLAVPTNLGSGIYVVDVWAGNNHLLQKKMVKQ